MDERGLWKLFFATGLPEIYLALTAARRENETRWRELAKTAFRPKIEQV